MRRVHTEISECAKELGYEYAGISGTSKYRFFHPVTRKTVFCGQDPSSSALHHAIADLKRGAGLGNQGKERERGERGERRHKRPTKAVASKLVVNETELKEVQKIERKATVLQNQLNLLFKEAASRKMSPEQTVAFAHTFLRITFKNFHTTEKEVRDAYDIHRGNASFVHRMFQPGSRGGWHRIG